MSKFKSLIDTIKQDIYPVEEACSKKHMKEEMCEKCECDPCECEESVSEEVQQIDEKLKFEGKFKVGDVIRAYDFKPMKGRSEVYIQGKIIKAGSMIQGAKVYEIKIANDSGETSGGRVGDIGYVPMQVSMMEYDDRIVKVSDIKESKDEYKDGDEDKKGKKKKGEKDQIDTTPSMDDQRMTAEETLDELSRKTLRSYMNKASDARGHRNLPTKKVDKRYAGVKKASDKLAKEETLDELSRKTLRSYASKASDARGHRNLPTKKVDKRYAGVKKASDKLAKEETELGEAILPSEYKAGSVIARTGFGGHRAHVVNKKTGKTMYLGSKGYKTPKHAEGEAQTYLDAYHRHSGNDVKVMRAILDYQKSTKQHHVESAAMKLKNTIIEARRGRPKKNANPDDTEGGLENIQIQLRKSVNLRGMKDVEFGDGKKVKVSAADAQKVLSKLDAIRMPKDRQHAVIHIAKSHQNMKDFAAGKAGEMDPEKRKEALLKRI